MDIPGRCDSNPGALSVWVPNTNSDDVLRMDVTTSGGAYATTVTMYVADDRVIGLNPMSHEVFGGNPQIAFIPLAGSGQVAFYDVLSSTEAPILLNLPGARFGFSSWSQ